MEVRQPGESESVGLAHAGWPATRPTAVSGTHPWVWPSVAPLGRCGCCGRHAALPLPCTAVPCPGMRLFCHILTTAPVPAADGWHACPCVNDDHPCRGLVATGSSPTAARLSLQAPSCDIATLGSAVVRAVGRLPKSSAPARLQLCGRPMPCRALQPHQQD